MPDGSYSLTRCADLVALQEWSAAKSELLSKTELQAPYVQGLDACLTLAVDQFLRFGLPDQRSKRRALAVRVSGFFEGGVFHQPRRIRR